MFINLICDCNVHYNLVKAKRTRIVKVFQTYSILLLSSVHNSFKNIYHESLHSNVIIYCTNTFIMFATRGAAVVYATLHMITLSTINDDDDCDDIDNGEDDYDDDDDDDADDCVDDDDMVTRRNDTPIRRRHDDTLVMMIAINIQQ